MKDRIIEILTTTKGAKQQFRALIKEAAKTKRELFIKTAYKLAVHNAIFLQYCEMYEQVYSWTCRRAPEISEAKKHKIWNFGSCYIYSNHAILSLNKTTGLKYSVNNWLWLLGLFTNTSINHKPNEFLNFKNCINWAHPAKNENPEMGVITEKDFLTHITTKTATL